MTCFGSASVLLRFWLTPCVAGRPTVQIFGLAAALLLFGLFAHPASAQQSPAQLVIHLYVDPIYGDDGAVNREYNPDGNGLECPPAAITAPHSVVDGYLNPLLHAPYPFKTITKAIEYINRLAPQPGSPPLPHTDLGTGNTWAYCIIHLLPGLYSKAYNSSRRNMSLDGVGTQTHYISRVVPNGEVFPLHIPPRVSLVGTSVLNTIIDTGQVGTAIEFGVQDSSGLHITGESTYIDKIAFVSCGGLQEDPVVARPEPDGRRCAAILIDDQVSSRPTITNCVFLKNAVGLLVNASENALVEGPPPPAGTPEPVTIPFPAHHGTTVINCTFAWNMIGLWNGQIDAGSSSIGVSRLNLVNNIFDGSETLDARLPCNALSLGWTQGAWPNWTGTGATTYWLHAIKCSFQGVSQEDLRTVVGGQPIDFNAYEQGVNRLTGIVWSNFNPLNEPHLIAANLAQTAPRVNAAFSPDPLRNIAQFTGYPNQGAVVGFPETPRGVLFVSDLICRGQAVGAFPASPGFDGSMHDLRLSPMAVPAQPLTGPVQNPVNGILNPLVDSGFAGPFPWLMENGQAVQSIPGTLSLGLNGSWPHHAWEADGEGYGNPRIHDHPAYAAPAQLPAGASGIDVGADEVGELIVAGYRFGTTSFFGLPPSDVDGGALGMSNSQVFYLGPPSTPQLPLGLPSVAVPQPDSLFLSNLVSLAVQVGIAPPQYVGNWMSGEMATGTSAAAQARPCYAIRHQNLVPTRRQPAPLLPVSVGPSGTPLDRLMEAVRNVGQGYRATAADVTPSLLPDIHPWWTDLPPLLAGSQELFGLSPSLVIWQDPANCGGGNYFWINGVGGFHNPTLYTAPVVHDINPPGSGAGGTSDVGQGYAWLDMTEMPPSPGLAPVPAQTQSFAENWVAAPQVPLLITDFDIWCRGGTGGVPTATVGRSVQLPSTLAPSAPEATLVRFSLEWSDAVVPWQLPVGIARQKNLQSFQVLVK